MLSWVKGPEAPLSNLTIGQVLAETAARWPDREALVSRHQNIRLSWTELLRRVDEYASGLAALGLRPGDRVGVWSANCAEWVLLQLACGRSRLVLVNVNPAYRSHELGFVLRKSAMKALFLWERDARAEYLRILGEAIEGTKPPLRHVMVFDGQPWREALARGGDFEFSTDSAEVVNIQYTSGTTGSPKGVLLTHHNLLNNALLTGQMLQASGQDRLCLPVPLYHCFGCVLGVLLSVATGCTLILPSRQFDALAVLETIAAERATMLYGVPTMFIAELEHPEFRRFDMSSLRTGIMAGAPCPIEVMKRVTADMSCRGMTIAYGQTESSPLITMSAADDPLELRVSTIGAAIANTEVKIISPLTGETLPVGQQGELCTRGYLVMRGYDGEEEATRRAIDAEGWLHTGDLALMREDGYFRITGRAKDLIIRGGENIYPREIEEFLYTHPKVADVQVVGVPYARLGETLAAWLRLKSGESATEEDIRAFCNGRIAHFKIPQYIRFVDRFPMTVTGKIQKFKIREEEIRRLGLERAAKIETA